MTSQMPLFFEKLRQFLLAAPLHEKVTSKSPTLLNKEIIFENVSFTYPDGRVALKNISFTIHVGERIALVGENGAGKTTLIKLLLGLHKPTSGCIFVDGISINELDKSLWRKKISAIFQDFGQYHFTVKENIGIANIELLQKEGQIKKAASRGGFAEIAESLPQSFDTVLGKELGGTNLSGGEWQKLALSRAFMRDADLLILDEPTASLDPQSEYELFERFSEMTKEKTSILITHRLGSVSMADRILVMKDGLLVEEGDHEYLYKEGQEYKKLFSMQAKRYQFQESGV